MKTDSVIVFRKYLLPYSETFIAAQGGFLHRYTPLYAGFKNDSSGLDMLEDSSRFVLEDYAQNLSVSKMLHRLGLVNKQWLRDLQQQNPSVVHAHFLKDGLDALPLKNKLSVPLVTTLHGHDIAKKEKRSFFGRTRKRFFDDVDKVIVVSDYIYNCAVKNGCPEDKLVKHFIGIDIDKFSAEKCETESPEILFVGRLVEKKGCIYLLQAMKILKKKHPELKLTIVGDGPLRESLSAFVQVESLNVEFVGRENSDQIRERLSRTWVFVAPSITAKSGDAEGLAMVFLEAQAMSTPIVSYDSGGIAQGVENGVTGYLHKEKDVNGLVESIEYFIENADVRKQFGNKGRERVETFFNVRKQCALLESIYDSVR